MTIASTLALACAVLIFAAIPGPGVMSLVAHSVTRGFVSGALWAVGLVVGDLCYLLLALFGMGWVAQQLGTGFLVLKWCGAAYLIYLGISSWLAPPPEACANNHNGALPKPKGYMSTLGASLCVSLGNPKLIAFYCGFLPGFVDMQQLTALDIAVVVGTIIPTVLSVLLCYVWIGYKGRNVVQSPRSWKFLSRGAGTILIGSGVAVAAKS